MTARVVLRIRRSVDGLPPPTSDEELIAWSRSLVRGTVRAAHKRREPLRAPSRRDRLTDDEIFEEIRARVADRSR